MSNLLKFVEGSSVFIHHRLSNRQSFQLTAITRRKLKDRRLKPTTVTIIATAPTAVDPWRKQATCHWERLGRLHQKCIEENSQLAAVYWDTDANHLRVLRHRFRLRQLQRHSTRATRSRRCRRRRRLSIAMSAEAPTTIRQRRWIH